MSLFKDEFGLKPWAFVISMFLALVVVTIGLAKLMDEKCTPEREGVTYHAGQYGGIDKVCHNGMWKEK